MRKFIAISILLFCVVFTARAQQAFQYSQYMLDKYQFNPAYGGLDFSLNVNAAIRSQWSGLPGGPSSQYVNAHMPFYIWKGAIGLQMSNESAGGIKNISIAGSYNYVYVSPFGLFSGGASLGVIQKSVDGTDLITPDGSYTDGTINHNDPRLDNATFNGIAPIWSIGGFFKGKQLEVGVSLLNFPSPTLSTSFSDFLVDNVGYLFAEYKVNYNEEWEILPSALLKTDFKETQLDISVMGRYNGRIFGSIGIRGYNANSIDALVFMAGTKLSDKYTVAYSFDTGLSAIKRVNEGSHEIRLIYNLNRPIATGLPPKIIYNPRFL